MPPSPAEPSPDAGRILTDQAEALLHDGRFEDAVKRATRATALGGELGRTWAILARAFMGMRDPISAYGAYGQALAHAALDRSELSREMGLLALSLGHADQAESLLAAHLAQEPAATPETVAALAQAQTAIMAYDRAHATLKAALEANPEAPGLWLALGQLLCAEGRHGQAGVFFEEALRLDPALALARDGLADARLLGAGDAPRALAAGDAALAAADDSQRAALAAHQARRRLALGQLDAGWAQLAHASDVEVRAAAPAWDGQSTLRGRLLLMGEDSLTDELMLAAAVPELARSGPPLILAVDPRWEALARRSFAGVQVVPRLTRTLRGRRLAAAELDTPHLHAGELVGAWAPLRAVAGPRLATLAAPAPYLQPNPERVGHWRERLAGLGPGLKIGAVWPVATADGAEPWEAPPLAPLAAALALPDVRVIALRPREALSDVGWIDPPPELQTESLDDLAAFAVTLDLVIGPPDALTYAAAACGVATWLLATPRHWARLGADTYPWLPGARVFCAAAPGDWTAALEALRAALMTQLAAGGAAGP
ncbi:MAG: hypothetical protein JF588_20005 [Caulobacterales bacterium]|nr:hypothetical protein [Caulobacterales bacterium]